MSESGIRKSHAPTVNYERHEPGSAARTSSLKRWTLNFAVAGGICVLICALLAPPLVYDQSRATTGALCATNLHQIGRALSAYAAEHNRQFPDSLDELLGANISSKEFVCPATADTPAVGPTTLAVAAQMRVPGHLSYIYLGKGLTKTSVPPNTILVREPKANHRSANVGVLYANGTVDFLNMPPMTKTPKRLPTTKQSATEPSR